MRRFISLGRTTVVASVLVLTIAVFVVFDTAGSRLNAVLIILGLVLAYASLPIASPKPDLAVEYRNPKLDGRAVVTASDAATDLTVFVCNRGRGPAEAVEVRFDGPGPGGTWNESGNHPDRNTLDITVSPCHFFGRDRVLAPGDEWPIALLSYYRSRPTKLRWQASARGMKTKTGEADIERVEDRPQ